MLGGEHYEPAPLNAEVELIAEFPTHTAYHIWIDAFDGVRAYA